MKLRTKILLHPIEHRFVPAFAVQRSQHPVAFVREHQRLGAHAVPPKRREKLQTVIDGHTKVELIRNDKRWRFILSADRCGEHLAKLCRAAVLQGGPPNSHSTNHNSSVASAMDSRLKTPSCETAALKRSVWPMSQSMA